jgi:hypothetical protein
VRDAAHDDTRSPVVQQVAKGAVVVGEAAAAVAHAAVEQVPGLWSLRLSSCLGVVAPPRMRVPSLPWQLAWPVTLLLLLHHAGQEAGAEGVGMVETGELVQESILQRRNE